jgi:hypothetical protein
MADALGIAKLEPLLVSCAVCVPLASTGDPARLFLKTKPARDKQVLLVEMACPCIHAFIN